MYSAYKLKKGKWEPAKLRITSFAIEKIGAEGTAAFSEPLCNSSSADGAAGSSYMG